MTDAELERRIRECADAVRKLCDDLSGVSDPSGETISYAHSVTLGSLLSVSAVLGMLCTEPPDSTLDPMGRAIQQLVLEGLLVRVEDENG